ncbi:MAG: rhodanese-like domain-containing protein [Erythrobacter sp.]|jgi:rhodanese-related sulfurtransferase|nr:rhodanese-like domain-containing protein [Erythrobacter sp.]
MKPKLIAGIAGACAMAVAIAVFSAAIPEPADKAVAAPLAAVRDVSVAEADALVRSGAKLIVLDVRTPGEFARSHIAGAVNLDFSSPDFAERLAQLDPDARYLLHCKSGTRSAAALAVMREQGFRDIAHMSKGFDAWRTAGMAVAR